MQVVSSPQELAEICAEWHKQGQKIALVPTMGYCHAGHEALMSRGREQADRLVVSIFVNPSQFGPNEDLSRYPRDMERDLAIASAHGADLVFTPEASDMFPEGYATWVELSGMAGTLCGLSRPVHFRGVCTVVLKLFLLTMADFAFFGEKDWQQQAILRRMAKDLNLSVKVEACPTVREADGLALSSRNVYLSDDERKQAPGIRRALLSARDKVQRGEKNASMLVNAVLDDWKESMPNAVPDYVSVVDPETLAPVEQLDGPALMACAVKLGNARLIDNILLKN